MSHSPTWWTASLVAVMASVVHGTPVAIDALMALALLAAGIAGYLSRPPAEPTTVYRLFAADGSLLYVGMSRELPRRLRYHERTKFWWPQVASTRTRTYRTRTAAAVAEHGAIMTENPRYNVLRLGREEHLRSAKAR